MGTANGSDVRADLDQIAETRREIGELRDAWKRRHRLRRGTPEYSVALEREERLVSRIWRRLGADGLPVAARSGD